MPDPLRSLARKVGRSSAATRGRIVIMQARPEPPSSTPRGRVCLLVETLIMMLSFRVRRGTPIPGGELGVPRLGILGREALEWLDGIAFRHAEALYGR